MNEMRIAAIGDLHCKRTSVGEMKRLLTDVENEADLLILAGDLTNIGLIEEMEVLLEDLSCFNLPKVAVVGNHDHESDHVEDLIRMLKADGIVVLDGGVCQIDGIGFVGTKGFCGGFGNLAVQPFGESTLKTFIRSSIEEALHLENALAKLDCKKRVGVLHYAPIRETLRGESPELFPFLGSSLLASALERYGVDVIVHGHAHNGFPEGRTPKGIPVYNVSRFVQTRYGKRAYALIDL